MVLLRQYEPYWVASGRVGSLPGGDGMTPETEISIGLPRALGFAGLIPFVVLAFLVNTFGAHEDFLRHALLAYGACIVSFVGAVHWGLWLGATAPHARSNGALGWSVVPAVAAWFVLVIDTRAALGAMAALLMACLLMDMRFQRCGAGLGKGLPGWYMRMRIVLTTVGALSLLVARR